MQVDGKVAHTQPLKLEVTKPQATGKDASVKLEMKLNKYSAYVGEPVRLDIIFKRSAAAKFDKVEIAQPEIKALWAKKLPDSPAKVENGTIVQTYSYLLSPQQEGNYTIPATFAKLGTREQTRLRSRGGMFGNDPFFDDPFFRTFNSVQMRWKKLFSNEETLHVKALPNGLDLYGDFQIQAKVDKKSVQANKPVNLTIMIEGEGNLEDIKKFDLDIPNAIVYADEPSIQADARQGAYSGIFKQKIAIVADQDYTIPAITLHYFDKKSKEEKTIQTDPIAIHVKGATTTTATPANKIEESIPTTVAAKSEPTSVQATTPKVETSQKAPSYEKFIYLALGLVLGLGLSYLLQKSKMPKQKKKEKSILHKIKKAKDDKALFELLLPYAREDKIIKESLDKLERNIYQGADEKIDKEAILEVFEELE